MLTNKQVNVIALLFLAGCCLFAVVAVYQYNHPKMPEIIGVPAQNTLRCILEHECNIKE